VRIVKFAILGLLAWLSLGSSDALTVIRNPDAVAPFELCFAGDNWPKNFVDPNNAGCLTQNLTVDDYKKLSGFQKDFFVAVTMWQSYFYGQKPVHIQAFVNVQRPRSGGNAMPGQITETVVDGQTMTVVSPRALSKLQGNLSSENSYPRRTWRYRHNRQNQAESPDILVSINPTQEGQVYCIDEHPTGTRVCKSHQNLRDMGVILLHELGHGYGIRSLRKRGGSQGYGEFQNDRLSAFDLQINHAPGFNFLAAYRDHASFVFTGSNTVAYLKSIGWPQYLPICNALATQNFSHFCVTSCNKPAKNQQNPDLMDGTWCLWKDKTKRLEISSLDLHVLSDIGYASVLKTTTADPQLRKRLFNSI